MSERLPVDVDLPLAPVAIQVDALPLAEWVCLVLAASGATHGWAIVKELAPTAELGSVWSLSRQLTYRAIDQLVAKDLLVRHGPGPGRGQGKVLLAVTTQGRDLASAWLQTPVGHVREVRTEGLLKLLLRRRMGWPNDEFLLAQQAALAVIFERLAEAGRHREDLPALLRREQARAVQRFLLAALRHERD